jgi:hypothetical protein
MNVKVEVRTSGSRDSLRDLGRVGLEIEPLPRPFLKEGLSREEVFTLVQARLHRVPVQVLSRTDALHMKGAPTLFLQVSLSECGPGSYLYAMALELVQGVSLERLSSPRFLAAPTWSARGAGLAQRGRLSFLKEQIGVAVDAFVDAKAKDRGAS